MPFAELVELSKHYNEDGKMPGDAPKEGTVFEVQEQMELRHFW